jgi:hypothetical protein
MPAAARANGFARGVRKDKEAMVFHARKWGWKRIAANLLLVPVFTGASAAVAHAQYNPVPAQAGKANLPGTAPGDAKAMLKEGRRALKAGQFDRAQDLARAAEANNPQGKWGLFDDTPSALLKDVQSAVVEAQKTEANDLLKQAKSLMAKPAPGGEAERAANFDQALQMAQRADQLHGPYSAWDFGDRPDKLVKSIQAARGKLKNVPPATGIASMPPTVPSGTKTAGNTPAFIPAGANIGAMPAANDPKKLAAAQLLADGRKLADQRNYAAARAKYMEADRLKVAFGTNEFNPGFALQDLNARGIRDIEAHVAESHKMIARKDYEKAEANVTAGAKIAAALGLYARPVENARAQLHAASGGKFGGPATPAPGSTAPKADSVASTPTVKPIAGASTPGAKSVVQATGGLSGKQLLDQAAFEFSRGDLDMATKLALQAHNMGGAQEEARAMLNSIDAERLAQKKVNALRSCDAAQAAVKNRDFNHAMGVLMLIDPNLLPAEMKARRDELMATCRTELEKSGGTTLAAATQPPAIPGTPTAEPPVIPGVPGSPSTPGSARLTSDPRRPDSVATQAEALRKVQFQKLRSDGLKIQTDAQAAFGRGETDLAIQMLVDYANRVRAANLEASSVALLLRPIESRLEMFRVMKGQTDAIARVNKETRDAREIIAGRNAAEEQRKTEVASLVRQYHQLVKKNDFGGAERVAMQAKALDPDNPAMSALYEMAKMSARVRAAEEIKNEREKFVLDSLNAAERVGPMVDVDNPVKFQLESARRAARRGSGNDYHLRTRSQAEYDIELKLDKPISIEFSQTPLETAIDNLREVTKLPLVLDHASLDAEGLSAVKPVTVKPGQPIAARHLLAFTLEQAGLSFVVESDLVKVTTARKAKGRLFTKVFSVADLVTPIPNFALPEYSNFEKMIANSAGRASINGFNGTPVTPPGGLGGGTPTGPQTGQLATMPGIKGGTPFAGTGGTLDAKWESPGPLGASSSVVGENNSKHEQLIKLLTSMIRPYSWDGMGGPGKVEFFDIGNALVVNQTADVIKEVEDLLEALRRLQDLALAVEVRIVSLSETWFERMGVDFSMNIKTHTSSFEPSLTQIDGASPGLNSGVFRPVPFINDLNREGVTVGLTPAGTFTPDLDVPIRPRNFQMAVPPFGGYPNMPGQNGGISLGLAFLNDIQVYMFMEAAQGDRRVNVMQAPKLTLFNGQTATLTVTDLQFFVTNVTVVSVNGQIVFIPNNSPFPGPGNFADPTTAGALTIAIQGVVSADRRFVRLNMPVTMSAQSGATVPLFPFTTFVTPVFEGGSQGQPIPFTQFLQQPAFTTLTINTTVVCPDGGTVLLGGFKQLSEGRNEFGPPVLSKIPYLNRLFKNVGIGRETKHIMIMVTPRIIINSEEEIFQTEGRPTTVRN